MTAHHRPLDESDILLIDHVKLTPSLYDPRNGDFRLAYRKIQDWEKVATRLGLNSSVARRRWTCLRDRYSRELRQLRSNPAKDEFGKNEFFRQMDFLRTFVRKRRERSRKDLQESWEKSLKSETVEQVDEVLDTEQEEESQTFDDSEHNYESKTDVNTAQTEEYPEYVEDANESYDEYVDQQPSTTPNSSNEKTTQSGILPILMPQTTQPGAYTSYTARQSVDQMKLPQLQQSATQQSHSQLLQQPSNSSDLLNETEDDYFCKSIGAYLRQLSRRHKIKAKVEMYQILDKYIELEESSKS